MHICSHVLGILHPVNISCFVLVGGESESAFFFSLLSVHIVKLKQYFTLSPGMFIVDDPKDAISVVHVNKMLATVS